MPEDKVFSHLPALKNCPWRSMKILMTSPLMNSRQFRRFFVRALRDFSKYFSGILVWQTHAQTVYCLCCHCSLVLRTHHGPAQAESWCWEFGKCTRRNCTALSPTCSLDADVRRRKWRWNWAGTWMVHGWMPGAWMTWDAYGCLVCPRHWRNVFFFAGHGPLGIFLGVKGIESGDTWRYRMDPYGSVW